MHSSSSSSRMHVVNHNWSATIQRLHPQGVAEISCALVLFYRHILVFFCFVVRTTFLPSLSIAVAIKSVSK